MTRKDYLALAHALRKARPPVIAGTNVIPDDKSRKIWYDTVTEIAKVCDRGGRFDAKMFFNNAGALS